MKKEKTGAILLIILGLIAVILMFLIKPIVQDEHYHLFSDTRGFLNIPNFWNVMSNYPFILVGGFGLINIRTIKKSGISYVLLYLGIILVAIGSGYYHLFPSNHSLVWDRLPMTIVFMTLFSIIIREYIYDRLGELLLFPLILIGLFSVGYWVFSASGDLRFYTLIQFYPLFAIPVILIFFKSKFTGSSSYWILLVAYVIAKVFEYFDEEIYRFLGFISGHSLKHILASFGLYILVYTYKKRSLVVEQKLNTFPESVIRQMEMDSTL